ncbi:MAG: hypothetical protein JWM98_34 [Thermoleophilia bacterium]|nr:hypothetical protein [Thermoleophilia bacterium]
MEGNRIRGERALRRVLMSSLVALVASAIAMPTIALAAGVQARTLFMTEQVRPSGVRGPLAGPVQPQFMVAQPGEEEGFMLAIRPGSTVHASATVDPGSSAFATQWTQVLRSQYVTITRPSTGMGSRPGRYADPLPPQVPTAGNAGRLTARGGEWSAFAVIVSVPATATAGTSGGTVVVRDEHGTVLARAKFSVTVVPTKNSSGSLDPAITPHDPRNFKLLFNFNPNWYRALAPADTAQDQYEQTYRTLWMLARHRAAPNVWQKAYPSGDGTYGCSAADGYLKVFDQIPWWADGKPGAVPVALMPNHTVARCDQDGFTIRDEKAAGTKFDDAVGDKVKSAWFIYRVADHWRTAGIQDSRAYFLNPFDEPSAEQNATVVPEVNKLVHDYAPGVKVLGTTWPMETGGQRVCRTVAGRQHCAIQAAQKSSNANLRDGQGGDDLDGWIAPYFRMYGFASTPEQKLAGVNRAREVVTRLKAVQKAGGEAWTYDLPLATKRLPQLAIDGPSSDARFLFWPLGREGFNGWFSAVTNRWVDPVATTKPRNPWDAPLSWVGSAALDKENTGPAGVVSNGWGSLYYPGLRPQLGLTDPLAQPVSSLRLERMRDGVEDANLMRQYRTRFGQSALNRVTAGVVGPLVGGRGLPNGEAFPAYTTAGLSMRMEIIRRQMLAEMSR